MIHIAGFIEIKCMFNEESFKSIVKGIAIQPEEARAWIVNNVVGRITKK